MCHGLGVSWVRCVMVWVCRGVNIDSGCVDTDPGVDEMRHFVRALIVYHGYQLC